MVAVNYNIKSISNNLLGDWYNQLGSNLHILEITNNGHVNGYYQSPVGTNGERFQLSGVINSKPSSTEKSTDMVISFTINWGREYGSITSWVGYFEEREGSLFLHTKWHLVIPSESKDRECIISSKDVFTQK